MKKQDAERVIGAISKAVMGLVQDGAEPKADRVVDHPVVPARAQTPPTPINGEPIEVRDAGGGKFLLTPAVMDAIYRQFRNRMIDDLKVDPVFLKLFASAPELDVEITPRVVNLEGSTLKGRIARLIASGWFTNPKTAGGTRTELKRTGPDPGGNLSAALRDFQRDGFLTEENDGWQKAPGIKVTERRLEARSS